MSNFTVTLTSTGDNSLPELVLVHGWGLHAGVWQALADQLEGRFRVHLLNLPGYGCSVAADRVAADKIDSACVQRIWQLENLLRSFAELPIGTAIWCGWSLGGMLATHFTARYPDRVKGLMTVGSNALFVQRSDWPTAMPVLDYRLFCDALATDTRTALTRFASLVCQGSATARTDVRALKRCLSDTLLPEAAILQASLTVLNALDTRAVIRSLELPQQHLFGQHDALVPVSAAEAIGTLNRQAEVRIMSGAGHALFLSHPRFIIDALSKMAMAA